MLANSIVYDFIASYLIWLTIVCLQTNIVKVFAKTPSLQTTKMTDHVCIRIYIMHKQNCDVKCNSRSYMASFQPAQLYGEHKPTIST